MKYQLITAGIAGFMMLFSQSVQAQLSGIYTIDQTVPTIDVGSNFGVAARNFPTFGAAVTALNTGITGNVTFYVRPGSGPYVESPLQINDFTGNQNGYTVTFEGGGNTIQMQQASPASIYAFQLNGVDRLKIHSLIFDLTGITKNPFFGVQVTHDASDAEISACRFMMPAASNSHYAIAIGVNDGGTSPASDPNAGTSYNETGKNLKILGNLIEDGHAGVYFGGYNLQPTDNTSLLQKIEGVEIIANQIHGTYKFGLKIKGLQAAQILRNSILMDTLSTGSGNEGIGIESHFSVGAYNYSHNRINNAGFIGVNMLEAYHPNPTGPGTFANNMIGGNFNPQTTVNSNNYTGSTWGLHLNQVNGLKVFNNTVNIHTSIPYRHNGTLSPNNLPTVAALFVYESGIAQTGLEIRNNSFSFTGCGDMREQLIPCEDPNDWDCVPLIDERCGNKGLAAFFNTLNSVTDLDHNSFSTTSDTAIIVGATNPWQAFNDVNDLNTYLNGFSGLMYDLSNKVTALKLEGYLMYKSPAFDLHLTNNNSPLCGNGSANSIIDDIDGQPRQSVPDIGADEIVGLNGASYRVNTGSNEPGAKDDFKLAAFPVPFQKEFTVSLTSAAVQSAQLTLTDMKGRIVYQRTVQLTEGTQQINIKPGTDLAKGAYQLVVQQGSESSKTTLIKE